MELDLQRFRVEQLVRDLSVVLFSNVSSKNIEVLYDIGPRIPEKLLGNSQRLQQALINLGGNAVKFTTSGRVVVGLRLKEADAPNANLVRLEFWMEDSGIGIAPENLTRIFTDFSQAESSTRVAVLRCAVNLGLAPGEVSSGPCQRLRPHRTLICS